MTLSPPISRTSHASGVRVDRNPRKLPVSGFCGGMESSYGWNLQVLGGSFSLDNRQSCPVIMDHPNELWEIHQSKSGCGAYTVGLDDKIIAPHSYHSNGVNVGFLDGHVRWYEVLDATILDLRPEIPPPCDDERRIGKAVLTLVELAPSPSEHIGTDREGRRVKIKITCEE